MKDENLAGLYIVLGLALALIGGFAIWMIGADTLKLLAIIFGVSLSLALLLGASALPIRAWKRKDNQPVVEHHFHDGTRTIERHTLDGRTVEAPRLLQLPAPAQSAGFPELLQAAYRAGAARASTGGPDQPEAPAPLWPAPTTDLEEVDPSGWGGDIRP